MTRIKLNYEISRKLLEEKFVNVKQGNKRFTIRYTPEFDEKYILCQEAYDDYINEYNTKQELLKKDQEKNNHEYSVSTINTRLALWLDDLMDRGKGTPSKKAMGEQILAEFPKITKENLEWYLNNQPYFKF